MAFRDFDAAIAERTADPLTFRLGGREWTVAHVNAANFLQFARQVAEGGPAVIFAFDDYISRSLADDQREDFPRVLREADVPLDSLIALAGWIVEAASGNPTSAASSSPSAPSKDGKRPRVVSLSPVSTTVDSASAAG